MKQLWTAIRALLILTVVLGLLYPLAIGGLGQLAFTDKANGQLVRVDGEVVGSAILGQSFTDDDGNPLPEWFQSRPSGADYNGGASSGTNYGPNHPDQIQGVADREATIRELDGVEAGGIPNDALTASGSGLDPHISPEYARLQVARVADARGLDEQVVRDLVESMIQGRDLGYLGEPTVNVLQLNIALAELR